MAEYQVHCEEDLDIIDCDFEARVKRGSRLQSSSPITWRAPTTWTFRLSR